MYHDFQPFKYFAWDSGTEQLCVVVIELESSHVSLELLGKDAGELIEKRLYAAMVYSNEINNKIIISMKEVHISDFSHAFLPVMHPLAKRP